MYWLRGDLLSAFRLNSFHLLNAAMYLVLVASLLVSVRCNAIVSASSVSRLDCTPASSTATCTALDKPSAMDMKIKNEF